MSLFFYGLLLTDPHWVEDYTPPQEGFAGVYYTFAQEFLDLPDDDLLGIDRDEYLTSPISAVVWLDDNWRQRGDPVCIDAMYEYFWEPNRIKFLFLGIRETLHREFRFTLPDPINCPKWDRLLRAKCEAHHLQYEVFHPPRFYVMSFLDPNG